jgi:16S rRNA (cytidine1402-2'-O)-methyltransferase
MNGKLYIVATPIGNLGDITIRAVETLKMVDYIACEDTRHTLRLLNHLGIKKPLVSYHKFSESAKTGGIIEKILDGSNVALVSDAGTPAISDPGQVLVRQAIDSGVEIVPIPGASAVVSGLSVSGLNTNEFTFVGFLPHKQGRQTKIREIAVEKRTAI